MCIYINVLLLCTDVAFTHVIISLIHSQYSAIRVLFVFVRRKNKVHKVFFYTAEIKYCRQLFEITQNGIVRECNNNVTSI